MGRGYGLGDLGSGFLAGFQTMDGYYRGQKADARADKQMGLQEAAWQNQLERQKVSDSRYEDQTDYARGRDKIGDERYADETKYSRSQQSLQNRRADAQLGLAQAANRRSQEAWSLQQEKYKRDLWQEENMPAIRVALGKFQTGEQLSDADNQVLNNPYATRYNPYKVFGSPEFHDGANTLMGKMSSIIKNPEAKVWDHTKIRSEINTPEVKKYLGVMLRPQLDSGIGTVTPSGTVKSYGEPEVIPTGRGTFFIQAPVTYVDDNGKETTKVAPITEGRSGDGKAVVQEFTPEQFIDYFGQAAVASRSIQANPEQWDTFMKASGLSEPADWKGYRAAVVKIQSDANKNISQIQRDETMSPESKRDAIAEERRAADEQVLGLRDVYGIDGDNGKSGDGGSDLVKQVSSWADGRQDKQQFIQKLVVAKGESAVKALIANGQLENAFNEWSQKSASAQQEQQAQQILQRALSPSLSGAAKQ